MNHYLYTPGNPEVGVEPRLQFVADTPEDMRRERFTQINAATEAFLKAEEPSVGLTERVEEILCADFGRLPVAAMSRQLSDQAPDIIEAESGLFMFIDHEMGSEVGELAVNHMPIEDFWGVTDDLYDSVTAKQGCFTHYAYQSELVTSETGETSLLSRRSHYSLGTLDKDGNFVPELTLLAQEHPYRAAAQAGFSLPASS